MKTEILNRIIWMLEDAGFDYTTKDSFIIINNSVAVEVKSC